MKLQREVPQRRRSEPLLSRETKTAIGFGVFAVGQLVYWWLQQDTSTTFYVP